MTAPPPALAKQLYRALLYTTDVVFAQNPLTCVWVKQRIRAEYRENANIQDPDQLQALLLRAHAVLLGLESGFEEAGEGGKA